jgi:hypothetical protein
MDATVTAPNLRSDLSEGMTRANNIDYQFISQHYLLNRKPDYTVYLYNVSQQNFEVSRPPILKKLIIPGKRPEGKYVLATSFPCPLLHPRSNVDSNEFDILAQDTRRFVMDLINPDNFGLDQGAVNDPKSTLSQGTHLGVQGLFWSLHNPPLDEEVDAAIARIEKHYKFLIEQANAVQIAKPTELANMLTPAHHFAADYFGEEYAWHAKKKRAATGVCPNCGDSIREGAAFHKTDEGVLCIIDWPRAIKAGVRTKQQAIEAEIEGFIPAPVAVPASSVIVAK